MIDIKSLEMSLSENVNNIIDGKNAGNTVDVTDTFLYKPTVDNNKKFDMIKNEKQQFIDDFFSSIYESTHTPVNEGLLDFFKSKPEKPKDNSLVIANPTEEQLLAITKYCKNIVSKLIPSITKCINSHPKTKSVFYIEEDYSEIEACLHEGVCEVKIVSYDLWDYKGSSKYKGRDLLDDNEFRSDFNAVFKEIKGIISSSGEGKGFSDGDVEDGGIYIRIDNKKLKDHLNKSKLLYEPIKEARYVYKNHRLTNNPSRSRSIKKAKRITNKDVGVHEAVNYVIDEIFSGRMNEFSGGVMLESIISSDEDIFYNKKAFIDGDINLCFIVGLSGSGMSHMASEMSKGSSDIEKYDLQDIIHNKGKHDADYYRDKGDLAYSFFSGPGKRYYLKPEEVKPMLNLSEDEYREQLTNAFVDFAVKYANSHKDTKFIVEGVYLHRYINPSRFRDYAVCVLGTSIAKSMYNSDKSIKDKAKSTLQYAGDDMKLNKFKSMFKGKNDNDEEDSGFDSDYEYESAIISRSDEIMHDFAMNSYMMANMFNENALSAFLEADPAPATGGTPTQTNTATQTAAPSTAQNQTNTNTPSNPSTNQKSEGAMTKFINFLKNICAKISETVKGFFNKGATSTLEMVKQNLTWLRQNENVIKDPNNWPESMTIQYEGDYMEGLKRFNNTKSVQYIDSDNFRKALGEDSDESAIKMVTSGWQGFNYDPNNKNLAQQFKNYFLATDTGQKTYNFKQLADSGMPKQIYDTLNGIDGIQAKVKEESNLIDQSLNNMTNNVYKELRDNNKPTITNNNQPTENTNEKKQESYVDSSGRWVSINEANGTGSSRAQQNAQKVVNQNNGTNAKIQNNGKAMPNTKQTTMDFQTYTNRVNKFNRIVTAYSSGKYTAIQQICSNLLNICKAVVNYHNQQAKAQNNAVAQNQNAQSQQPAQTPAPAANQ